jgi:hypothetical protein
MTTTTEASTMTDSRFTFAAVAAPATLALLVGASTYVTQQSTAPVASEDEAAQGGIEVTRDGPHDAVAVALERAVRAEDRQIASLRKRLDAVKAQTRSVQQGASSYASTSGSSSWTAPTSSSPSIPNQPAAAPQTQAPATSTTTGASGATPP